MLSNKRKSKLFSFAWNGEKIRQKYFFDFLAPPQTKLGGVPKLFVKNEKNQSRSELTEIVSKFLEYQKKCLSILFTLPPQPVAGKIMIW